VDSNLKALRPFIAITEGVHHYSVGKERFMRRKRWVLKKEGIIHLLKGKFQPGRRFLHFARLKVPLEGNKKGPSS